ncbi:protein adenylyltransferase Fic [Geotalea uraniireducens]|uniref:Filamentation induced by cAMP protein Fic n=1 Tax=Geotalea uraniireducens (strain Rf4) TaxID=351605 RepID=A5G923_GEOUR|nr:Fic family protein [Geotalea uraniireducens]ABQ28291.1 filamentation induced by cAMP protein Fic [Geotalea uraniireducens Rf4]
MPFNPLMPYNDLPLLPPQAELESKDILRKAISANRALAELKGAGELIPNQSMLINSIPLQEARTSSEIENIITTNDKLFQAAAVESASDPATKEVLHYRTALKNGFDMLQERPISVNLMIDICRTLKNTEIDVRKVTGTTLSNPATGEVYYTPPEGEGIIREKLGNLETYIHQEDDLDPLIKMAVMHYQFEAIHPFHDGNGRTGRILNILFLVEKGLLKIPVLYLSRYIIQNKNEYYRLLREVTAKGAWEPWVIYMLAAIEETALWTCEKIKAIRDLLEETVILCKEKLSGSIYSRELVDLIFVQPYCKIAFLVEAGIAERKTASVYLQKLEGIGVLRSAQLGREKVYINPRLIDLLNG